MKIDIDSEVLNGLTVANLKDWYEYLLKDQQWFEADEDERKVLEEQWGYSPWVHPLDYAHNVKYIKALELIIPAFGGDV